MKKIIAVMALLLLALAPAVFAQDSLESSVSGPSGLDSSISSEESRAEEKTDAEIAGEEASGARRMEMMDESMAGNSTSQMTAVEQADE